jgi:hypothetical protein
LFNRHAATSLNTDEATNKALDAVSGKTARVCPLVCGRGMKADGDTYVAVREPPSRRERESKREPTSKRKPVVKREPPRRRDEVHERGATRARGQACSLWVQQPELRVAYLPGRAPLLHLRLGRYAADYLSIATMRLGKRESATARLEPAVAAYRDALKERTRKRVPLDWAMTQNNLGLALTALGERESGTARLNEAVAAYRANPSASLFRFPIGQFLTAPYDIVGEG